MRIPDRSVSGRAPFGFCHLQLIHGGIPGRAHGLTRFSPGNGEATGFDKVEGVPDSLLQLVRRLQVRQALGDGFPELLPGQVVDLRDLDQLGLEHFDGGAVLDDKI